MSRRSSVSSGLVKALAALATHEDDLRTRLPVALGCLTGIKAEDMPEDMREGFARIKSGSAARGTIPETAASASIKDFTEIADDVLRLATSVVMRPDEFQ